MPDTPEYLAERLKSEGEKVLSRFAGLDSGQWQEVIYTEGGEWRLRDVLAHFLSAERQFLRLFDDIKNGGPGVPEGFDIDGFNGGEVAAFRVMQPDQLLRDFEQARAAMTNWVSGCSETDLQKVGRHPFLGMVPLADMVKMVYRHHQIHLRDFRAGKV